MNIFFMRLEFNNVGVLKRLLAKGIIPLSKVLNYGSLKYQVDLLDDQNNKLESVSLFI